VPLLDHFHPPIHPRHHGESFHSNWATRIADALNEKWLPPEYLAEEYTQGGTRLEIDVATFDQGETTNGPSPSGSGVATAARPAWSPPASPCSMPAVFPETFEVRVFSNTGGATLVAAIELISPANKDRPEERRAFATKCASYLYQGISLIIIDVVTSRQGNLHNEIMRVMEADSSLHMEDASRLYAVAYRPVVRQERSEIDLWPTPCALGAPLPVMPLRLTGDLFVPVDFEATYQEACKRRRLV
jgi:hypothetical protein